MRAMVLEKPNMPLRILEKPDPSPGPGKVLVKVSACGVCRTDLHIVDGDLTDANLPIIPGHEFCGEIVDIGKNKSPISTIRDMLKGSIIKTKGTSVLPSKGLCLLRIDYLSSSTEGCR